MNDNGEGAPPPNEGDFNYEDYLPQPLVVRLDDLTEYYRAYQGYMRHDFSVGNLPNNRTSVSFSDFIRYKLSPQEKEIDPDSPIHIEVGFNRNPEHQIQADGIEGISLSERQNEILRTLFNGVVKYRSEKPRTEIPVTFGDEKNRRVRINWLHINFDNPNDVAVTTGLAKKVGSNRIVLTGMPTTLIGDLDGSVF